MECVSNFIVSFFISSSNYLTTHSPINDFFLKNLLDLTNFKLLQFKFFIHLGLNPFNKISIRKIHLRNCLSYACYT